MKHFTLTLRTLLCTLALLLTAGVGQAETVKYTITSKTAVSASGDQVTGSSAQYSQTFTQTAGQITKPNTATLKLSGFDGCTITGIVLEMKSNKSAGSGTFYAKAGNTTLAEIASATAFNKWYDNTAYSTSYKNINVEMEKNDYTIGQGEVVEIKIAATVNSLYIQSYTITYTKGGGSDPTPEKEEAGLAYNPTAYTINLGDAFTAPTLTNPNTLTVLTPATMRP